jgi:hypothetical protein
MRLRADSDSPIKTKNFGGIVFVNTDPDSSSFFLLENFGEEMMKNLEVVDQDDKFKIEVSFFQINGVKKTYTFRKDINGEIAIFDGDKKLKQEEP